MRSVPTTPATAVSEADLLAVADLWERARLAGELAAELQARAAAVLGVRRDAVHVLVQRGEKQSRIARYLGMSPTRVNQLVTSLRTTPAAEAVAA